MPRFFFHIRDGHSVPDTIGIELPDIYAAQDMAIRSSGRSFVIWGPNSGTAPNGSSRLPTSTV